MAATRAVARAATTYIPHSAAKGAKGRASLIYEMHSKLYPDLYNASGQPKKPLLSTHNKTPSAEGEQVYVPSKAKGQQAPNIFNSLKEFQKEYKDARLEKAVRHTTNLEVYPAKPSIRQTCPDPVSFVTSSQIALLDPTGARTRLFSKTNPECARVGDILLVRQRTGDPFAGVCINIRRRGVDTAILLRGQLTRVGVEMWYKIYSPLVEGIEVVQRAAKRARRARLTYLRKEKHDRGSVENVVRMYLRQKAALGTADGKKKGAAAAMGGKKVNKRGKHRR